MGERLTKVSDELIRRFEDDDYQAYRGNYLGVKILDKRMRHERIEYYGR